MFNPLYHAGTTFRRLYIFFSAIFDEACTKPTSMGLVLFVLSMLVVEGVDSVRSVFKHFYSRLSVKSLNSLYYLLSYAKIDRQAVYTSMVKISLSIIPESLSALPVFLCIDDSMIEKFGTRFEHVKKLYDHAHHGGKDYINA